MQQQQQQAPPPVSRMSQMAQSLQNTFRRSAQAQAPQPVQQQQAPEPPAVSAEWGVEFRVRPGVVRSVKYTLPGGEEVEVTTAPFRVARRDETAGTVKAE